MIGSGFIEGLLDLLFPPRCAACDELGEEPFCALCEVALLPATTTRLEGLGEVRVVFQYGGPAALALFRLKYQGQLALARPLGRYLRALAPALPPVDLVLPIPLSRPRLVERGFNQTRELLRGFPGPVDPHKLVRRRATPPQARLSAAERARNVADAFGVRGTLRAQRILLVDDVVTTGSTLREAARALRLAGAREVHGLCLLRADQTGEGA